MKRAPRSNLRTGLRILLAIVIAVIAILMFTRWPIVWIPAVIAAVLYCMDVTIAGFDRRALRSSAAPSASNEARDLAALAEQEKVGLKTALTIFLALAAIAVVIASALVDWKLMAVASLAIFAWIALLGLPFWLAAVEEEVETEHDQRTGESRSIH